MSLQSCPDLCDPIDGSPPGSPSPGILQARTLEWVAISFSNAWKWKVKGKSLSRVWLFATPWTTAHQAQGIFSCIRKVQLCKWCESEFSGLSSVASISNFTFTIVGGFIPQKLKSAKKLGFFKSFQRCFTTTTFVCDFVKCL